MAKHRRILLFILAYSALILQLSKLGSSLLVHFLLKILPLDPVFLVHLSQNIHLVVLSISCFLGRACFILSVLLSDRDFNLFPLVVLEPFQLLLLLLLQQDVLFSRSVHIFEKVNSGLLLPLPLHFAHFVLSLGLLLNKLIYKFLVCRFVILALLVIFLQLDDLLSPRDLFCFF